MNAEHFEYDEDVEVDETWEDTETTFEATDEDTEMAEDTEVDEAQDEYAMEAEVDESEAGDEGAEADIEAAEAEVDESDEAARVSAKAQYSAQMRQQRVAAQLNKEQRAEQARAKAHQQRIASQVQAIKPGAAAPVQSLAPVKGTTLVKATLPNGRSTPMRLEPSLARTTDVNNVRRVMLINERRQAVATRKNSKAISRLANAQAQAAKTFSAQLVKGDQEVRKRILETYKQLDGRITKELSGGTGSLDKHGKRMMASIRRQRQRSLFQSLTLLSTLPGLAAFGTPGDIKSANNLIVTGSAAGYLLLPEVVDFAAGKEKGVAKTGANWLSYLGPIANPLTVFFLLRNKQSVRYISGITDVTTAGGVVTITKDLVKEKSLEAFKKDTHAVVATLLNGPAAATVTATLVGDKLTLQAFDNAATPAGIAGRIAWIIDTQATALVPAV